MNFEPPVNPEALWRLATAASAARLSPYLVESVINAGQIPGTSIVKLGPRRLKHIARPDLYWKWVKNHATPPAAAVPAAHDCSDLF